MSKLHRILFLIFTLFLIQNNVFAADDDFKAENLDSDLRLTLHKSPATSPECLLDVSSIATIAVGTTTAITGAISGIKSIISGNALIALPEPWSQVQGYAMITGGVIGIATAIAKATYVAIGGVGFGRCAASFVRDNVRYYPMFNADGSRNPDGGKMIRAIFNRDNQFMKFEPVVRTPGCANDKDCYYLGMPENKADKIVVCARGIMPVGIFSIDGCYKRAARRGWITFVGGDVFKGNGSDYYNGPDSLLCPEEFRQVWRLPELEPDNTGYHKLKCNEGNLKYCPKGSVHPGFKSGSDLENYKLTFNKPTCKEGKKGDKIYIDGYKYKITQNGVNLCATLTGLGELPWVQPFRIGCIKASTSNAIPKCAKSKPIFEDFTRDPTTGLINNYGSQGLILRYDDAPCGHACNISALCTTVANGLFKAPIPITSYLMACIRESSSQMVYGCNSIIGATGSTTPHTEGMLYTVQNRMRVIIILAMILSVTLFGMQVALGDNVLKLGEITAYMLKLALVIYLTTTHSSGDNGMARYMGYIDSISNNLQAMVMHSVTKNGLCKGVEDANYEIHIPGEGLKDLSYLRVWDMLDCKFAFYFSTAFSNTATAIAGSANDAAFNPYDRPLFYQITGILNVPFRFIISFVALILFALFLIFTIMQICELVICAFLAFSILVIVSPIFVPFLLFKSQKQIFDAWINQVVAYSLYPVLIFAFMAFLFLSMDKLTFGETNFVPREGYVNGNKVQSYAIDSSQDFSSKTACNGFTISDFDHQQAGDLPIGCDCSGVNCMLNASVISSKSTDMFISKTSGATMKITGQGEKRFMVGCLSLMFIMFIYYQLTKEIYSLLNALAGSMRSIIMHGTKTASQRMEGAATIALGLFRGVNEKKGGGGPGVQTESSGGAGQSGQSRGGGPNVHTESSGGGGGQQSDGGQTGGSGGAA